MWGFVFTGVDKQRRGKMRMNSLADIQIELNKELLLFCQFVWQHGQRQVAVCQRANAKEASTS